MFSPYIPNAETIARVRTAKWDRVRAQEKREAELDRVDAPWFNQQYAERFGSW